MHFKATKRVLRYVRGTLNHEIWYEKSENLRLIGFTDSDWAGFQDDMKSTSVYVFTIRFSVFSWNSKK